MQASTVFLHLRELKTARTLRNEVIEDWRMPSIT
jgi:hypothetical protein